ncbi:hypothetical protein B0A48_13437 [Cryoendolithus antarcticus]|uniref:C3H1-type domain-containing protein n=1 Tax=Cryoendolithus antarcticus TaxID=1507870 RepID=A0A1V8SQ86_9PEZI|nr:hypothetical protein B0A48_13437 [Cryoendolithus antarcticus]
MNSIPMPMGNGHIPPPYNGNGLDSMNMAARSPPRHNGDFDLPHTNGARRGRGSGLSKRADTSHVPCKFYLQGQCQAGRMCPFSHDLESITRPMPCKYFAKGHCKFGTKCSLLHITPDGIVMNRRYAPPPQQYAPGGQGQGGMYAQALPGLLSMQALGQRPNGNVELAQEDGANWHYGGQNGFDVPQLDYSSSSPQYGSPTQADHFGSPPQHKGLSVLDAPLPSSFDSNGISMAARNGPFAASVPSRFGIESPPSSLPHHKSHLRSVALRDLHTSAFGNDRSTLDSVLAGSSPPSGNDEPLSFPKRILHSERLQANRHLISSSVGTHLPTTSFEYSDDSDEETHELTDREEDLLPASLRDLIPENRPRRTSRGNGLQSTESTTPAIFLAAQRRTLSSNTTPQESKVGSPAFPTSSSPSRYSGIFGAQQRTTSSDFIGSPLRNTGFPNPITTHLNGDLSPTVSSPTNSSTMSGLTADMQRAKLGVPIRGLSTGTTSNGISGRKSLDRNLSSTSVGRGRIDEEAEEEQLFDMDEVVGAPAIRERARVPATSNGDGGFGPIGGTRGR